MKTRVKDTILRMLSAIAEVVPINNRWIDQLRRDNNNTTSWPVEKIHHTWSYGSDATVLDDYALTTTTMISYPIILKDLLVFLFLADSATN